LLTALTAAFLFASPHAAAGSISGVVLTRGGDPAPDTRVGIPELRRRVLTDEAGAFRFDGLPPGHYDLEAMNPRFGTSVAEVDLDAGVDATLTIRLDLGIHSESVVVTASPEAKSAAEISQPTSVFDGPQLQARVAPSLGETLSSVPGIHATSFSPGSSRPVIRGFAGDRIRVLENGLGTGDASSVSPDHAVSLDPLAADRIEVVRGPASLLYGNAAVGGVVNVLDGRIPDHPAETVFGGVADFRVASAAEERATGVRLHGGTGPFAWQIRGLDRRAGDLETPEGPLANSDLDTSSWSTGGSWVGRRGYLGLSFTDFSTNYGIAAEEDVRIDLDHRRYDVRGAWDMPFGPFRSFKGRMGFADYEHREIEGGDVGTTFTNDSWEGRFELAHKAVGPMTGTVGVQWSRRDFAAIGEEAYVRPNDTENRSVFLFEEIGRGAFRGEVGLRYERQETAIDDPDLPDRAFGGVSASVGAVWLPGDDWSLALSLSRTSRMPTPEELYSDGPHVATNAFEIGDPLLDVEVGLGADLSLRKRRGKVHGELTLFWNRISDYIYDRDTGRTDPDEGLPIFLFTQDDARFAGIEGELHVELVHAEPHHLGLEIRGDSVRAEFLDLDENLPRIPPLRLALALRYQGAALWGDVEWTRVAGQDRVAPGETTTPGYTWINATVGYRILAARLVHDIIVRGTNLTDRLARNHVSRFKETVPLTGRDVALSYRLTF
jgi:iron complex outermembrane receptor protein